MRLKSEFKSSKFLIPLFGVLASSLISCGKSSSVTIDCTKATGNSSIVQAACGTASSSTTTTTSTVPPPPPPLPTCSYSEQRVYSLSSSDLTLVFSDPAASYTRNVTASTCMGVNVGPAGTNTEAVSWGAGTNLISVASFTGNFDATIPATLSWFSTTACSGTTRVSTSMSSGALDQILNTLTLNMSYSFDPNTPANGC